MFSRSIFIAALILTLPPLTLASAVNTEVNESKKEVIQAASLSANENIGNHDVVLSRFQLDVEMVDGELF